MKLELIPAKRVSTRAVIHAQLVALLGIAFCALQNHAVAQGALTPSGPPGPVFKTLSQIEPRAAINTLPGDIDDYFIISQPGSYYLTTNVVVGTGTNGMRVLTNDVDIDLNGFTFYGTANRAAIRTFGPNIGRIHIHNGQIAKWGGGISFYTAGQATNLIVEDVRISLGGTLASGEGIACGEGARISRCTISEVGGSFHSAIAVGDRSVIDGCLIANSYGGIITGGACMVKNCIIRACIGDDALRTGDDCIIQNNLVEACKSGISFRNSCKISDNSCLNSFQGSGFSTSGSFNHIDSNLSISNSAFGFTTQDTSSNNVVIKNMARGNPFGNFSLNDTDNPGPLINTSGTITNTSPWANFSY